MDNDGIDAGRIEIADRCLTIQMDPVNPFLKQAFRRLFPLIKRIKLFSVNPQSQFHTAEMRPNVVSDFAVGRHLAGIVFQNIANRLDKLLPLLLVKSLLLCRFPACRKNLRPFFQLQV